jgi:aminomethyltransferase
MTPTDLKRTPLYAQHVAHGAKLVPFAGYEMPIRYTGDTQEHLAVRERVGLFDVSHMGEFLVRGPKALDLIQALTSNDVSKVPVGKAQYNCLPNPEGGIIDDLIVYHLEPELYLVVVNAANIAKDWAWFAGQNAALGIHAELTDLSEQTALLALSGPKSVDVLRALTSEPFEQLGYYACLRGTVAGLDRVLIATTGYTGERTFELYCRSEQAEALWKAIIAAGQPFGIEPVGLGARDTLRLEMGYMLYGNDITDGTSPLEAGLGWITKLDKPAAFTSQEKLRAQKSSGVARKLVGFTMVDKGGFPRGGMAIYSNEQAVGEVTSGGFSPSLKVGIGLGYVPAELAPAGTKLQLQIRDKWLTAEVTPPPFVKDTSLARWQKQMGAKP